MRFVLVAVALFAVTGCKGAIKEKVTKDVLALWNDGKVELIDSMYTPEAGKKVRAFYDQVKADYPDFKITIDEMAVDGDVIYTRWTSTGTHAKYGKTVKLTGLSRGHMKGQKGDDEIVVWDRADEFKQLGYTMLPPDMEKEPDAPEPPAAAAADVPADDEAAEPTEE